MATSKITNMGALLLVFGMVLILGGGEVKEVDAKICPQFCYDGLDYMTCPSTGSVHLNPACNCCIAGPGCTLFFLGGTTKQC
ncbi:hypothetical protein KSS87_020677 [Heliosperma pusillum]|nr:hypothetical protein KSS87_020677 [Heliosperma pusillum]